MTNMQDITLAPPVGTYTCSGSGDSCLNEVTEDELYFVVVTHTYEGKDEPTEEWVCQDCLETYAEEEDDPDLKEKAVCLADYLRAVNKEERVGTDELQSLKDTILAALKDQAVSLNAIRTPELRDAEMAVFIGDCLPSGEELAELFAANCDELDWTNLDRMMMDLEEWGCPPGHATTTDAIRYALTKYIIGKAQTMLEETTA